jgi:hypothetical protein
MYLPPMRKSASGMFKVSGRGRGSRKLLFRYPSALYKYLSKVISPSVSSLSRSKRRRFPGDGGGVGSSGCFIRCDSGIMMGNQRMSEDWDNRENFDNKRGCQRSVITKKGLTQQGCRQSLTTKKSLTADEDVARTLTG